MTHIECQTPGCPGFSSPEYPDSLQFCGRCGWPLGKAEYFPQGGRISYPKGSRGQLSIRVRNTGTGSLRWDIHDLPEGLRKLDRPTSVPPGDEGVMVVEVDGTRVGSGEVVIPIRTWDQAGRDKNDFRLIPNDEAFRTGTVTFITRTTKVGPLTVSKQALLFFPGDRKQSFNLKNEGESELTVELTCENCDVTVALCADLRGRQTSGQFQIDAGLLRTLEVRLDDGASKGTVTLSCPQVWDQPHQIQAIKVVPESPDHPEYQYVVAVDFGTTKSAVMVHDQWYVGAEPEPILWPKPKEKKDEWYVPSEVHLVNGKPSGFGWEAGDSGDMVRSVKTQLLEGSEFAKQCVTYLLERIFDRVAEVKGSQLLSNAQIVMSLPVLDDGERAEAQRQMTVECALEAGQKYGLRFEQMVTYSEPECALVDILHTLKKSQQSKEGASIPMPSDGDWLCVVDIGGGTTDISLTQFGVSESGRPELRHLKVAGFSRAGDFIDQELFLHCLQAWSKKKRLVGPYPEGFNPEMQSELLELKGEPQHQQRSKVFNDVRRGKEYIYDHTPERPYDLDNFGIKLNRLKLDPAQLNDEVIRPAVKALFAGQPSIHERSFREHLEEWKIPIHEIRYLFLTGGTSRLPSVLEVLRSDYLTSPELRSLPNPEPRKNVVRGAALRPSLRLPNMLPLEVTLRFGEDSKTLRKGCVPGVDISVPCRFNRGQTHQLQVLCHSGKETLTLACFSFTLPADNKDPFVMAKAFLRYTLDCQLQVKAEWLRGNDAVLLSPTEIASFPKEEA